MADIPESKDLTGVLNGNQSKRNYHRCISLTEGFKKTTADKNRSLPHTRTLLSIYNQLKDNSQQASSTGDRATVLSKKRRSIELLAEFSMAPYGPVLTYIFQKMVRESPSNYSQHCVDPDAVFRFEPLHKFHLGITRMLLRLVNLRARAKLSRQAKVLDRINYLLREVDCFYKCVDLRIAFYNYSNSPHINGIFTADDIFGMLEGRDYRSIEKVLPFIGTICDRAQPGGYAPLMTTLFSACNNIPSLVYRRGVNPCWTETELKLL